MIGNRNTLKSLLSVIFLDQTCFTITFPLLTLIFFDPQSRLFPADTAYATRSIWYGLCVSLPYFINTFFSPLLSTLSDTFGRKKILLIEISSSILFSLCVGCGIYFGILSLIFMGFIIRGAFSRTNPTALAMIGDVAPKDKKILFMGYLQFAISIGATVGPFLGGYFANRYLFNQFNFSIPYFIAASIALINTGLAFYFLRETLHSSSTQTPNPINWSTLKEVVTNKQVLSISLILLCIQISWSTYYQFMPPILKTLYHFDPHQLGLFISMVAVWLALASSVVIKVLYRYFNLHQILLIAAYLVLFGLIFTFLICANILPNQPLLVWAGAIPVASGDVIAYSCLTALYSNAVTHDKQGKVMGFSFIVVSIAWTTTGFIGGLLMSISPLLPLVAAPVGILTSLILIHANFGKKLALSYNAA